jgi:hypothetical protein
MSRGEATVVRRMDGATGDVRNSQQVGSDAAHVAETMPCAGMNE